jgi:DNA-binding winged helix-turn-helix (wHTH) protein/Tfp pilus assembly protein PilF
MVVFFPFNRRMINNLRMSILRFGVFELDPATRELRKRGLKLRVSDQSLRLLMVLVERAGRVTSRDQLRHAIWPTDTFVDFDRAINKAVSEVRRVLGDVADNPRFVETLSKRGYRFIGFADRETGRRARHTRTPSLVNAEANVAYLKGRYLWSLRTAAGLHRSIEQFQRALAIDDGFALAHAGLADAHVLLGIWGLQSPATAFSAARVSARRALDLDARLVEAHTCMAEVSKDYEWDWQGAERQYQHALALDPDYATAHQFYAQLLVSQGRYEDAVIHIELARRADPVSPAITAYLPYVYLAARQYDVALREARRSVDREPYSPLAQWQLGRAYLFSGQILPAVETLERAARLAGPLSMWEAELSVARARAGNRDGAIDILRRLQDRSTREYVSPYDLAVASAGIGDVTSALRYLERCCDERVMRTIATGDPEFDALRRESRYQSLVEGLDLRSAGELRE